MKDLRKYIQEWNGEKNLVFVTHYVVISDALDYAPTSGEIVISDKIFKKIDSIKIGYYKNYVFKESHETSAETSFCKA